MYSSREESPSDVELTLQPKFHGLTSIGRDECIESDEESNEHQPLLIR